MTTPQSSSSGATAESDLSLTGLLALTWSHRRLLMLLGFLGALVAGTVSLLGTRQYVSTAVFVPEEGAPAGGALAAAARSLGAGLIGDRRGWTPTIYVAVAKSQSLLSSLVQDTVTVVEEEGRRVALLDLFEIEDAAMPRRVALGVRHLNLNVIRVSESRNAGTVTITVRTYWPSVSHAIAQNLLARVNDFNLTVRQLQADAELRFAEARVEEAGGLLRAAEDDLLRFSQQNRTVTASAPQAFERDRLQRVVTLRNQLYVSLVQNQEEARLRKVRDTPVISVIEPPLVPAIGESRGTIMRAMLGGIAGLLLALGLIIASRIANGELVVSPEAAALTRSVLDALPRSVRARLQGSPRQ